MNEAKRTTSISKCCLKFTQTFFTTSFEKQLYRMSRHHYMGCWSRWVLETSWVESSNKSLQYSAIAPKITDPLHRAGDKILQHTHETQRRRQTEAVDMSHNCLPSPTGQASCADQCYIALSKHILPTTRISAFSEWTFLKITDVLSQIMVNKQDMKNSCCSYWNTHFLRQPKPIIVVRSIGAPKVLLCPTWC